MLKNRRGSSKKTDRWEMTSLMQVKKNENGKRRTDFYEFNGIVLMKFSRSMNLTPHSMFKIWDEKLSHMWQRLKLGTE